MVLRLQLGINLGAAVKIAKDLGPGHTVVTILCDGGSKYQSRLYNPEFLAERNLTILSLRNNSVLRR